MDTACGSLIQAARDQCSKYKWEESMRKTYVLRLMFLTGDLNNGIENATEMHGKVVFLFLLGASLQLLFSTTQNAAVVSCISLSQFLKDMEMPQHQTDWFLVGFSELLK